jgi:sulfate adenylyltransferase subunit 2
VWAYIRQESIPIVPLYFAKKRKMIRRGRQLIPVIKQQETRDSAEAENIMSRFRTLGCAPCTGAVCSSAQTLDEIIAETLSSTRSERETRIIDHGSNSMEDKKKEGYF